jgi:hypothetical protein
MSKRYTKVDDLTAKMIAVAMSSYHPDLDIEGVRVGGVFVQEEDGLPCLTCRGFAAAATIKRINLAKRVHVPYEAVIRSTPAAGHHPACPRWHSRSRAAAPRAAAGSARAGQEGPGRPAEAAQPAA